MAVLVTGGAGYIGSHMVWELLDAGEDVVVLDRLSTGFEWAVAPEAKLVVGDIGDGDLVRSIVAEHRSMPSSISRVRSSCRNRWPIRLAITRTTPPRPETCIEAAVTSGVPHFIFSSTAAVYGGAGSEPVVRGCTAAPGIALWPLQADDGMDAAGRRARPSAHATRSCAISMSPGPIPRGAPASRRQAPRISSRLPARPRWASARSCRCSATITIRRTAPACATISTSATWSPRTAWRWSGCGQAATACSPIAAMAMAIRCLR